MIEVPIQIIQALGAEPTKEQWEAISAPLEPVAIIAGAGSGKTAVIAARVVYLALDGMSPANVLALTFTNKAAEELARRVREACTSLRLVDGDEPTVLTYHAFASRLLDEHGLRIGLEPGQMLLSSGQQWQLATSLLRDREFEHLEVRTIPAIVRKLLELSDHCANHLIDPTNLAEYSRSFAGSVKQKTPADREAIETALERGELAELVDAYQKRKRELGAIDYGDQIRMAVSLLQEHSEVGDAYRARYPAVLLDEYQDTNTAQARMLQILFPSPHPVMCVGDPDQNIYAWRGASLSNILRFGSSNRALTLSTNFRSGSRILDAANAIIDSIPPERRAPNKKLEPHAPLGLGRVAAFTASDQLDEARRIATLIEEQKALGISYSQMAVLCRKRKLIAPILQVLTARGIPSEAVDLGGLLQVPQIVEIVAWLRLLNDPADNIALARLLQNPRWRIGYRDLVALARWSASKNKTLRGELGTSEHPSDVAFVLAESIEHTDEIERLSEVARDRIRSFRSLREALMKHASGPLDHLVSQIVELSGMMRELETSTSMRSARRNVMNFIAAVGAFAPLASDSSLPALVDYLESALDAEEIFEQVQLSNEDTVKLSTIHKAKGLEWDVVFVPGLADSKRSHLFPDSSRQPNEITQPQTLPFALRGDADALPHYNDNLKQFRKELTDRGLEEERRLCYVALTRARKLLVVSHAWWYEGPKDPYDASIFFNELAMISEPLHIEPQPAINPLIEQRGNRVPVWPIRARTIAAELPASAAALQEAIAELSNEERAELDSLVASHLARIDALEHRDELRAEAPRVLSVSAVLEAARDPKQHWDTYVRPAPKRQSSAAKRGSRVHRFIELASRGSERTPRDGAADPAIAAWLQSRFSNRRASFAERPVVVFVDGVPMYGRIDAIFSEGGDGSIEIVDYKTGARVDKSEGIDQLGLYARAISEIDGIEPSKIRTTYVYLTDSLEQAGGSATDPIVLPQLRFEKRPS
ncbi:MAG: ATP-dependent helicase [Actinomycetota bacterium]